MTRLVTKAKQIERPRAPCLELRLMRNGLRGHDKNLGHLSYQNISKDYWVPGQPSLVGTEVGTQ